MSRDTRALLQIGEALFGQSWQADLARALSVSPRTIHRWRSGEFEIPVGVWGELRELCRARAAALLHLADKSLFEKLEKEAKG